MANLLKREAHESQPATNRSLQFRKVAEILPPSPVCPEIERPWKSRGKFPIEKVHGTRLCESTKDTHAYEHKCVFQTVPAQIPLSLAVSFLVKGIPVRGPLIRAAAGNALLWKSNLTPLSSSVSAERAHFPSFWFAAALASRRVFTF